MGDFNELARNALGYRYRGHVFERDEQPLRRFGQEARIRGAKRLSKRGGYGRGGERYSTLLSRVTTDL